VALERPAAAVTSALNVTLVEFVELPVAGDSRLTAGGAACASVAASSRSKLTSLLVADC